ncbi:hypothetical protein HDU96_008692 [Phlyctochytrium bullatum]|nr:hypothetical protein HDU96_008692 [Phlyctochytrium bullatum]
MLRRIPVASAAIAATPSRICCRSASIVAWPLAPAAPPSKSRPAVAAADPFASSLTSNGSSDLFFKDLKRAIRSSQPSATDVLEPRQDDRHEPSVDDIIAKSGLSVALKSLTKDLLTLLENNSQRMDNHLTQGGIPSAHLDNHLAHTERQLQALSTLLTRALDSVQTVQTVTTQSQFLLAALARRGGLKVKILDVEWVKAVLARHGIPHDRIQTHHSFALQDVEVKVEVFCADPLLVAVTTSVLKADELEKMKSLVQARESAEQYYGRRAEAYIICHSVDPSIQHKAVEYTQQHGIRLIEHGPI